MINVYYSLRFNPIMRYYEILEHIPELERVSIVHKADELQDAVEEIQFLEYRIEQDVLKVA